MFLSLSLSHTQTVLKWTKDRIFLHKYKLFIFIFLYKTKSQSLNLSLSLWFMFISTSTPIIVSLRSSISSSLSSTASLLFGISSWLLPLSRWRFLRCVLCRSLLASLWLAFEATYALTSVAFIIYSAIIITLFTGLALTIWVSITFVAQIILIINVLGLFASRSLSVFLSILLCRFFVALGEKTSGHKGSKWLILVYIIRLDI